MEENDPKESEIFHSQRWSVILKETWPGSPWIFDTEDQKRVMEACHNDKLGKLASTQEYAANLKEVRTEVFTEVTSNIQNAQAKQKLYYDHKHARTGVQLGDHVL